MARTLIGQLILTLQQNFGEQAKEIDKDVSGIEASIKRLQDAPWGASFQRQLDAIKLAPEQLRAVQQSWTETFGAMSKSDFKTALQKADFATWRTGVVSHLAAVREELDKTQRRANSLATAMRAVAHPIMGALGYVGGGYMGYELARSGFKAAGARGHEQYLEAISGALSPVDQAKIAANALQISTKYPSISATQLMEMGRVAAVSMGSTDTGLALLPDFARLRVILAASQGGEGVADSTMAQVIRSIELSGKNLGPNGMAQSREILEGYAKALEVHSADLFDPGSMMQFLQRAKIAGPALSTDFLANVAPHLVQDFGSSQAGTQLASAFKSFLIGDASINGKVYKARQEDLGIRSSATGELVEPGLYGRDPYAWAKQVLMPALVKSGLNVNDDVAVATAVGKLSANTNATGAFSKMIIQRDQFDKWIAQGKAAPGFAAADTALSSDPYTAFVGLRSSFDNLAAALASKTDIIVPGINSLTTALNTMAKWTTDNPGWAVGTAAAGAGLAGWGAYKGATMLSSWVTAGTKLNTAADQLIVAAERLQGTAGTSAGGSPGGAPGKPGGPSFDLLPRGIGLLGATSMFIGPMQDFQNGIRMLKPGEKPPLPVNTDAVDRINPRISDWLSSTFEWPNSGGQSLRNPTTGVIPPGRDFTLDTGVNSSGSPDDRDHSLRAVSQEAAQAKTALDTVNSTTVTPKVDTSSIAAARAQVTGLLNDLNSVNSWRPHVLGGPMDTARDQLDRSFADHGIAP
jgi:hypothetical protein